MSPAIIDLAALAELPAQLSRIEQYAVRIIGLLEQRAMERDEVGGTRDLAAWLGLSVPAAKSLVHREPSLAALAARVGMKRVWTHRDVTAWIEARRPRSTPKLRAVGAR